MRFRTYPKIGSAAASTAGAAWVATEKVHGANFVVGLEGGGDDIAVRFGKRKGWLLAKRIRAHVGAGSGSGLRFDQLREQRRC